MKKLLFFALLIVLGWDLFWALLGVKPLFPWQLQQKMTHNPSELALLDVRTSWEFHWFHLPGAQNVPFEEGMPHQLTIPRNKTVVVICMTGHRSPPVAYHLLKAGYARVYNLTWGMAGWELWKRISGRPGTDSTTEGSELDSLRMLRRAGVLAEFHQAQYQGTQ